MMVCANLLIIFFGLLSQAAGLPQAEGPDVLTANEKTLLEKEISIENRIKIYSQASERIHHAFQAEIRGQQLDTVPAALRNWLSLLDSSLKDINANLGRKKKSKALKNFEIQLRRATLDVQGYKIKAPIEQQDLIDDWISRADRIRNQFMMLLFPQ